MARHSKSSSEIRCSSSWFAFISNFLNVLTFIMVAIIFITGIVVAVNISVTIEKGEVIVDALMKYVKKAEDILKAQSARIQTYVKEHDIPGKVRAGAGMVKDKSVQEGKTIKSNVRMNEDNPNYMAARYS